MFTIGFAMAAGMASIVVLMLNRSSNLGGAWSYAHWQTLAQGEERER